MKDTLYLIGLNPKPKNRTEFFYKEFQYGAHFYLKESSSLRKLDHDYIDRTLLMRKNYHQRLVNFGGSWYNNAPDITAEITENLHNFCDFLKQNTVKKKIVIYSNHVYIYCNDIGLFNSINDLGYIKMIDFFSCDICGSPGTVILKNPKHKLRTYFRSLQLDDAAITAVKTLLSNQPDVRMSPSLMTFFDRSWNYIQDHFFIDHDDDKLLLMLKLIRPELIRKTLSIHKAK